VIEIKEDYSMAVLGLLQEGYSLDDILEMEDISEGLRGLVRRLKDKASTAIKKIKEAAISKGIRRSEFVEFFKELYKRVKGHFDAASIKVSLLIMNRNPKYDKIFFAIWVGFLALDFIGITPTRPGMSLAQIFDKIGEVNMEILSEILESLANDFIDVLPSLMGESFA